MTTQLSKPTGKQTAVIGGAALMLFGMLSLAANVFEIPAHLALFAPGAIFTLWGLATRHIGPCIPGGILSGLATGVYMISRPQAGFSELEMGGVMMVSLAGGFFLISLLSLYTERGRLAWWPLIPGSIMASMSGLIIGGETGLKALQMANYAWPVALIIVGLYLVFKPRSAE